MPLFTADFIFDRETKGTYRYKEVDKTMPRIGTLYVKKSAFTSERPSSLRVAVETQDSPEKGSPDESNNAE